MRRMDERTVRRLVADTLGVAVDEVTPDVSLTDELAVDSLDMLELVVALEKAIGTRLSEAVLDSVRTYGDLVRACGVTPVEPCPRPVWVRATIMPAIGERGHRLVRVDWLTPYLVETVADDALRAGHGARLHLRLEPDVGQDALARVETELGWLRDSGVTMRVAQGRVAGRRTLAA